MAGWIEEGWGNEGEGGEVEDWRVEEGVGGVEEIGGWWSVWEDRGWVIEDKREPVEIADPIRIEKPIDRQTLYNKMLALIPNIVAVTHPTNPDPKTPKILNRDPPLPTITKIAKIILQ